MKFLSANSISPDGPIKMMPKSIDRERYPSIDNVHMKCGPRLHFKVFQPYSILAFEIVRLLSEQ